MNCRGFLDLVGETYSRVLSLLMLKAEELSIDEFNMYLKLLEDVLLSRGIGVGDLNESKVFLLIYYFLGCELKKRGRLVHFDFSKVKSEKFNEIAVEYSDCVLREEALSKDFCIAFKSLLNEISGYKNKALIGVV
ncbi:hypothetical protein DB313_04820 (plasmid) [Borrelia turcica IST7]|uniref:DUF3890 domain-containing protein n=1 Tax=Borrelia turcica IST7 TaxID=1104446 RepID=A0A386PMM2_9SPIR|nr:DUF3890 domain-containing protein [Borrelia turcica]AYE36824.1 hypothetical protein DB313_04820 [Borrelia turcica IST7]